MKQKFPLFVFFLFATFLVLHHHSDARLLATDHQAGRKVINIHEASSLKTKDDINLSDLMGLEECGGEDEECLKRRMVAEAHLDYIYTQQHKP